MISGVNIVDVLAQKTTERPEVKEVVKDALTLVKTEDFKPTISALSETHEEPTTPPVITPDDLEEDDEYDSEGSAEALIDMIDLGQKSLFMILGAKKLKKKIPDEVMERFQSIDLKDMMGEELTEEEQRQLRRYKDFEKRLERFGNDIPLSDDERLQLMRCTEKFVSKNKINIPPSVWFGVQITSILSSRVIDHIQL